MQFDQRRGASETAGTVRVPTARLRHKGPFPQAVAHWHGPAARAIMPVMRLLARARRRPSQTARGVTTAPGSASGQGLACQRG